MRFLRWLRSHMARTYEYRARRFHIPGAWVVVVSLVVFALPAQAGARESVKTFARFQFSDASKGWSIPEVKQTIKTAVGRWPVEGGVDKALAIAKRESGFYAKAANPTSSARGVYQMIDSTWRATRAMFDKLDTWTANQRFNARAAVLMAIKFVHTHSWSPWQ